MNELPSSNESRDPPSSQSDPGAPAASSASGSSARNEKSLASRYLRQPANIALATLAALLLAQWWWNQHEIGNLREEMAQRLRNGETLNTETKAIVKSVQDSTREMQSKFSILENKQVEAQGQQLALEQLYQELAKNRDDWALAEIEQVLSTASQQLQLAGNVQGAIIALQNADTRLSRSDKPQFIVIRRAIARDLDRLKALPSVDLTGMVLRLDSIISQIDNMPLLSDEKPTQAATQPKPSRRITHGETPAKSQHARGTAGSEWLADLEDKWNSWTNEMWTEIKQVIRVRNVESPDALLLSPTQAYYARENLKLRLLNARLALLTRNESAFRSDLNSAQDVIARYFDTRAKQTQAMQALLRQVQASNLSIEMPSLADSLNAVRNYKAKP